MAKQKKPQKKKRRLGCLPGLLGFLLISLIAVAVLRQPESAEPAVPEETVPFRAEDFVWENGRKRCISRESIPGIDVSYYQGQVDWEQVRASGIEFVFVRVGYRSAADGKLCEDEMARQNLSGAAAAGLKVGAYFFSQALTPQEAVEEAAFAVSIVKHFRLDLPLVYDWEEVENTTRTQGMTRQALTTCTRAFCLTVEAAGYDSMIYFNRDISRRLLDLDRLSNYPVWFAMYDSYPDAPCQPDYWQYTDEGTVPGIEGYVDLNLYFPEES